MALMSHHPSIRVMGCRPTGLNFEAQISSPIHNQMENSNTGMGCASSAPHWTRLLPSDLAEKSLIGGKTNSLKGVL